MRPIRGGAVLAASIFLAVGCNGSLSFDEGTRDATTTEMATVSPDADDDTGVDTGADTGADAGCADGPCGWRLPECGLEADDACQLHCAPGTACPNGTCGTACAAECEENSSCSLTAGDGASVGCLAGASCAITLGIGGTATCAAASNCRLLCHGRCSLICQAGATCQLRCGDTASARTVTGSATCP